MLAPVDWLGREDAATEGNKTILRTVNMRIPDSDEAQRMVQEATSSFEQGSLLHDSLMKQGLISANEAIIITTDGTSCNSLLLLEEIWCIPIPGTTDC